MKSKIEYYPLGIKTIDDQHNKFIDIYNNMVELLSDDRNNISETEILKIINDLTEYMKEHFKTEEELMISANYPEIEKHLKDHIYYIDKIDDFNMGARYKNPALLNNMLVFMKKWFISHIRNTDSKYAPILKEYLKNNYDYRE